MGFLQCKTRVDYLHFLDIRIRPISVTLWPLEYRPGSFPGTNLQTSRLMPTIAGFHALLVFQSMSSVPQIPGFYFDAERRKYFKIVNGDQRLNSSYSNNTIRAKARTEEFDQSTAQPRNVPISSVSIAAHRWKTVPADNLLHVSLGISAPSLSLSPENILSVIDTFDRRSQTRIWGTLDDGHVVVGKPGRHIQIYTTAQFLRHEHPLFDLVFDDNITDVLVHGQWTFIQWGKRSYRLNKWVKNNAGALCMEEKTQFISSTFNHLGDLAETVCGCLYNEKLHLLTRRRLLLLIDLADFSLEDHWLDNIELSIIIPRNSGLAFFGNICYVNIGKSLYIYAHSLGKYICWKFSGHIQRVLFEETKVSESACDASTFYEFVIVTTAQVHLRTVCPRLMKPVGTFGKFSIHNSNNAKPMVVRLGPTVIIEETPESYKKLNLRSLTVEDIRLPNLAELDRSTIEILSIGGAQVVSNHHSCHIQK